MRQIGTLIFCEIGQLLDDVYISDISKPGGTHRIIAHRFIAMACSASRDTVALAIFEDFFTIGDICRYGTFFCKTRT